MFTKQVILALPLILAQCAEPAVAQTTASVTIGTDYMSRGTSQTFGDPAVTLYVEHQFKDGFYVSGFLANVDFDDDKTFYDGTKLEADAFVGKRGSIGKVNYDVMLAAITYYGTEKLPTINPSGNWNMVELKGSLSRTYGKTTITGTVGITPDYFNNYGPSIWSEASINHVFNDKLSASAAFGRQQFFRPSEAGLGAKYSNYNTWNAGLTYNLTSSLSVDIRYWDNDTKIYLGSIYKPRDVVTLRKAF